MRGMKQSGRFSAQFRPTRALQVIKRVHRGKHLPVGKSQRQSHSDLPAQGAFTPLKLRLPQSIAPQTRRPTPHVGHRKPRGRARPYKRPAPRHAGRTPSPPIQIVKPQGSGNKTLPVVMYFHGGGWVLGGFDTHERLLKELANDADAAIVFVNFTHSPEAKYPVPLEEAYAATKWIAENGQTLNLDPSRLVVAVSDSVGGNMAIVVALLANERGGPPITFQLLFYPVTNTNFDTPSYLKYQEGYFLARETMKWFFDNYLLNDTNREIPTVSPLQASIDQLSKLPPALIIVGENDVLRDEGEAYAHKLMQAGVPTTATRYLGTIYMIL